MKETDVWKGYRGWVLVIERRINWSEGVHGRVAKWLIGLLCHKIYGLPLAKSSCITIPWYNYAINTARPTAYPKSVVFVSSIYTETFYKSTSGLEKGLDNSSPKQGCAPKTHGNETRIKLKYRDMIHFAELKQLLM